MADQDLDDAAENHRRFLTHLEQSNGGVWTIARWLHDHGRVVTVQPVRRAPTRAEWQEYADAGDIYIQQRIEVKQLRYMFTGPHDLPAKFKGKFMVCAKHTWDRAVPKPYAYVILNPVGSHAGVILGSTSPSWFVEQRTLSQYVGRLVSTNYYCPLDLIKWVAIATKKERLDETDD